MKTIIFALCLLVLGSCKDLASVAYAKPEAIPAHFDYQNTILLAIGLPKGKQHNKVLQEILQNRYPYRTQWITVEDLTSPSGQYKDSTLYRYVLMPNYFGQSLLVGQEVSNPHFRELTLIDYHIYDRLTQKHYPPTNFPNGYPSQPFKILVNTLMTTLNEQKTGK